MLQIASGTPFVIDVRRWREDAGGESGELEKAGWLAITRWPGFRSAFISNELSALPSVAVNFWRRLGIPVLAWTVQSAAVKHAAQVADNFFFDGYLPGTYDKSPPSASS